MNRFVFAVAFAAGLAAVQWVGFGFIGSSWLALGMTAVIAVVYLLGALELTQFRAATASLAVALAEVPQPIAEIGAWLGRVHLSLQHAVRSRIEGERIALPGPALTPYLVGLLVMLGMLGTFLGMVVTFKGAVFALEGSSDLQAIRSALAAPIKGLGLSFGTSVAGVAASAMLGLMSALARRERLDVGRQLDARAATVFRPFSLAHQRQETFKALQAQAHALPEVVDRLNAMLDGLERRSEQLNHQLLGQQQQFHREVGAAYTDLAEAVGQSLQDSLIAGARAAGESITPVVEAAMAEIADESKRNHQRLIETTQTQLSGLASQLEASAREVSGMWTSALDTHARTSERLVDGLDQALQGFTGSFEQRSHAVVEAVNEAMTRWLSSSDELIGARIESEAQWMALHKDRMDQMANVWRAELAALRDDEAARGTVAVERLGELQSALATQLATLGSALEVPMTRLMQTASEVPQAAAEVIAQLRLEMTRLTERDNVALEERAAMMEQINGLLGTVNHATSEQRAMIDSLMSSAISGLQAAGSEFSGALAAQAGQAAEAAAHVAASAIDLSSLGASFSHGVQLFNETNEKLMESLQRIEGAIGQSLSRSDEQLAYYVAQAREVIDLSITSQQGIVEDLRRLRGVRSAVAEGAA